MVLPMTVVDFQSPTIGFCGEAGTGWGALELEGSRAPVCSLQLAQASCRLGALSGFGAPQ